MTLSLTGGLTYAQGPAKLTIRAASVEFVAVGWPSGLRVRGKGAGPEGEALVTGTSVTGRFTFDLDQLNTGIRLRDRHMHERYLQTDRYPHAEFVLEAVEFPAPPPPGSFDLQKIPFRGRLRLHGAEQAIAGSAAIKGEARQLRVQASFQIRTSDFGIETPSFAGITLAEDVKVLVNLQAARP